MSTPPVVSEATIAGLGQLGQYSGLYAERTDADLQRESKHLGGLSAIAIAITALGVYLEGWIGGIIAVIGALCFMVPGFYLRSIANEMETRKVRRMVQDADLVAIRQGQDLIDRAEADLARAADDASPKRSA